MKTCEYLSQPFSVRFPLENIVIADQAPVSLFRRRASTIARQTTCGVAGIAMSRTPSGASASSIALITAGGAPIAPPSPQPLTPGGLVVHGTPWRRQVRPVQRAVGKEGGQKF